MLSMIVAVLLVLVSVTSAIDKTVNPALDASLFTAPTALDRSKLLPTNGDWLFDFNAQSGYTYSPGSVVNANAATFPALVGTGMTLAMLNLGPCAMLPPHLHPRATNLVVAIEGTTQTFMTQENGAALVTETLTPGKMTIFPQGSVHAMQNTGCGNATLVSALNSDDTGTNNVLLSLFALPNPMIIAAFGGPASSSAEHQILSALNASSIPPAGTGSILGSAECIAACEAAKAAF